jgi:hypothetical protein
VRLPADAPLFTSSTCQFAIGATGYQKNPLLALFGYDDHEKVSTNVIDAIIEAPTSSTSTVSLTEATSTEEVAITTLASTSSTATSTDEAEVQQFTVAGGGGGESTPIEPISSSTPTTSVETATGTPTTTEETVLTEQTNSTTTEEAIAATSTPESAGVTVEEDPQPSDPAFALPPAHPPIESTSENSTPETEASLGAAE